MAEQPEHGIVGRAIRSYFVEFGRLKSCSRQFWVVQLVNLLDGVAYFGMLTVSTLYLSETLGYNDSSAGWIWGLCMAVYTGTGFVAGFIGDSLGIKRTLYISVMLLVVSRLVVSVTEEAAVVVPALFVIAIGTAIMTPILISATKRYTTKESQTAGFNLLYFLMNIGAFLGNITIDPLRDLEYGNRAIFMLGSVMSILCWLSIMLFWRKGIDAVDAQQQANNGGAEKKKWEPPWKIAAEVFQESAFWRFMLFLIILIGVRLVFEHQYQVYPKYYQRTMAEFLLSTDAGALGNLLNEEVPDELRTTVATGGNPLGDETSVTMVVRNNRWLIEDGTQRFGVELDGENLQAFALEPDDADFEAEYDLKDAICTMAAGEIVRLNNSILSGSFRDALIQGGLEISGDANVVVNESSGRWRIDDQHEDDVQSYYVRRDLNKLSIYASDPPIGKLNSINPFIICIGVIISTPIVARFKLFNVMFVGIVLSASSMVLLVIYPGWFCHWFGLTLNQGYVVIAILQICLFSLGEVIWSPRLYEYTAAIAPEGREASYMGLSYLPMFFARFAEGPLAGALLTRYCPPDVGARLERTPYAQSPQFMHVILAALALATPILILIFRGVIQKESRIEHRAASDGASPA